MAVATLVVPSHSRVPLLESPASSSAQVEPIALLAPTPVAPIAESPVVATEGASRVRYDTLWIFDADFSDLLGDNAGWISEDRSGFQGRENYWHRDTLRPCPRPEVSPGSLSWWCGSSDEVCWKQPRGYGNDWWQVLERDFPLSEWSAPGDSLVLAFDQRYAMERFYDYGYVDVSDDEGATWTSLATFTNVGFMGAGVPVGWDHQKGHQELDASAYAGIDLRLRFRFESDGAYSAQDQEDNPPQHSVEDGAWQLDNIEWVVNGESVWTDDCESPGDNGWVHEDVPPSGQTGVTFRRGRLGIDFFTDREGEVCFAPPDGTWMMAAVDSLTGVMVDDQDSWLISPAIDVSGADQLVARWTMWVDLPQATNDIFNIRIWNYDGPWCPETYGWVDENPGFWYGGPLWWTGTDDWSVFTGNDSLRFSFQEFNDDTPGEPHRGGLFLVRHRLGVLTGDPDPRTRFARHALARFHDWFVDELEEAFADTALIRVRDTDGVSSVTLLASNTGGGPFEAYACVPDEPTSEDWYKAPPPVNQMTLGSEVLYYFKATDGLGNTAVYPPGAPDETFEMSVLPITASLEEPGILLVDKHDALVPGEDRSYRHASDYYYREALDILGYEYDVYDVENPGTSHGSYGPDTTGMRYYQTQIWSFADLDGYGPRRRDQRDLIRWLSDASGGAERNLLLAGENHNWLLVEAEQETLDFLSDWLATEFLASGFGDTLPVVRDAAGGFQFMSYNDGRCLLRGACPEIMHFDVVQPVAGAVTAEVPLEYEDSYSSVHPAGVAYTHPTIGYQTVNLGFGLDSLVDELLPTGHYETGIADRVDLLENILEYFNSEPTGPGTGATEGDRFVTALGRAVPNPFNPSTAIEYTLASRTRVRMRVLDLAGRTVRTLLDATVAAGEHRIVWDGKTDSGSRAASGVYFVRMEAGEFRAFGKAVLLK